MNKHLAEALGTFALVFCGTGAIALDEVSEGSLGVTGIALVFGAIVLLMVLAFAPISGAHLNPAITIALAADSKARWRSVAPYVASQLAGALCASLLVRYLFPTSSTLGATLPSGAPLLSFALEVLLTFLLMLVIFGVSKSGRTLSAMLIGITVGLEAYLAGPISGASMNPARSMAPALISGRLEHLWIFVLAPTLGALLAVQLRRSIQRG